jgi:ECM component-binding autotransporter adhesin
MSFILSIKINNLIELVNSLSTRTATNTANIVTNTANIATNTANIATNTANIATNTTNIATNTANIATNTANILTNSANIYTNTTNISNNNVGLLSLSEKPSYITSNLYDVVYNYIAGSKFNTLYYKPVTIKTNYSWSGTSMSNTNWYNSTGGIAMNGSTIFIEPSKGGILSLFGTTPTNSTGDLTFSTVNGQKNGIMFPSNGLYSIIWTCNIQVVNGGAPLSGQSYITLNYTFQDTSVTDIGTLSVTPNVIGVSINGEINQGRIVTNTTTAVVNITNYTTDFVCLSLFNIDLPTFFTRPQINNIKNASNVLTITRL